MTDEQVEAVARAIYGSMFSLDEAFGRTLDTTNPDIRDECYAGARAAIEAYEAVRIAEVLRNHAALEAFLADETRQPTPALIALLLDYNAKIASGELVVDGDTFCGTHATVSDEEKANVQTFVDACVRLGETR